MWCYCHKYILLFVVVLLLLAYHTFYTLSSCECVYFSLIILYSLNFKFVFVRRNFCSVTCAHNIITMIIWFIVCPCFRLLSRFAPLEVRLSIGFRKSRLYRMQVLARAFSGPSPHHHTVFYFFIFDGCGNIAIIMVQLQYLSNRKIVPREIIEVFHTPV